MSNTVVGKLVSKDGLEAMATFEVDGKRFCGWVVLNEAVEPFSVDNLVVSYDRVFDFKGSYSIVDGSVIGSAELKLTFEKDGRQLAFSGPINPALSNTTQETGKLTFVFNA